MIEARKEKKKKNFPRDGFHIRQTVQKVQQRHLIFIFILILPDLCSSASRMARNLRELLSYKSYFRRYLIEKDLWEAEALAGADQQAQRPIN